MNSTQQLYTSDTYVPFLRRGVEVVITFEGLGCGGSGAVIIIGGASTGGVGGIIVGGG